MFLKERSGCNADFRTFALSFYRKASFSLRVLFLISAFLILPIVAFSGTMDMHQKEQTKIKIKKTVSSLQIPFVENKGQIENPSVLFYANTFGGNIFVTKGGEIFYFLPEIKKENITKGLLLKEEIIGRKIKEVRGEEETITKIHYFRGKEASKWNKDISSYDYVSLGEIYSGIELKLKAYGNNVEKLFLVEPGIDPEMIKLKLTGAKTLKANEEGELEVETDLGFVRFTKPVAYQEIEGVKKYVQVDYSVSGSEYGFKVKNYDKTEKLIIDPLLASTFLGDIDRDIAIHAAMGPDGSVYITGRTYSSNFPTTPGTFDNIMDDNSVDYYSDVYISKLDSNLENLLASTLLGGNGHQWGYSLAFDSNGNVYVAGGTGSSDFPTTLGAYDTTYDGGAQAFVSKLDGNLENLLASTLLGGPGHQWAYSLVLDDVGNVYVTGYTNSLNFTTTADAFDTTYNGGFDVFVSKLDGGLATLIASSYLGGSGDDGSYVADWPDFNALHYSFRMSLDSSGNVFITSRTDSVDFPTTLGAFDTSYNGGVDGFISKISADLTTLLSSTYLGGGNDDFPRASAIGSNGDTYVIGLTSSADFPVTAGAFDDTHNGGYDGFVSKLSGDLTTLGTSTFLGGSFNEDIRSITLDSAETPYVGGKTGSSDFPVTYGAFDTSHNGGSDSFISTFSEDLTSLLTSTFLGGSSSDASVCSIFMDLTGNVYASGTTYSADFPTTASAYDVNHNGLGDVFVSKFNSQLSSIETTPIANAGSDQTVECTSPSSTLVTLDGTSSYDPNGDELTYTWTGPFGTATGPNPTVQFQLGTSTVTLTVSDGLESSTDSVNITVRDTTPPELNVTVSPETLFPPNHKMILIAPTLTATDACDNTPSVVLTLITSSEGDETNTYDPDYDSTVGDGNTTNDIHVDADDDIYLRAERSGTSNGRVYTITYTATDASGNSVDSSVQVTVPHNL